jgi:hypothetical protein
MKRFRFSLSALLVLLTALALFIGLSQARRRSILKETDALRNAGANVPISDTWWDKVWLRIPDEASVVLSKKPPGKYEMGQTTNDKENAIKIGQSLQKRLVDLGVRKVTIIIQNNDPKGFSYYSIVQSWDELPEPN